MSVPARDVHDLGQSATGQQERTRSKFDISAYVGDKPLTDIPFTELVYASMRWGVDFNWSSEKEVNGYMAHIGYIAMKAMAGLYVSEAMSSYDNNIRKAAELQGSYVFMDYNTDFTVRLLGDEDTKQTQTYTEEADCGEELCPSLSVEGHTSHEADDVVSACAVCNKQFSCTSALHDHSHSLDNEQTNPASSVEHVKALLPDQVFHPGSGTVKSEMAIEEAQITEQDINVDLTTTTVLDVSADDILSHSDDALQLSRTLHQVPEEVVTAESPHTCPTCAAVFGDTAALKAHVLSHTRENTYMVLRQHLLSPIAEKPHQSPVGNDRLLGEPNTLMKHKQAHLREKHYKHVCSVCGKKCPSPFLLKRHMVTHTGEKRYMCPRCGHQFAQKCHLKKHMAKKHEATPSTGDATHKCYMCGEQFTEVSSLQTHMATHPAKEKPYKCPFCERRFFHSTSLITHKRKFHAGKSTHACSHCKRSFVSTSDLKEHVRTHTRDNQCCQCGKRYGEASALRTHQLTHRQGDKMHKAHPCLQCEKQFRLPSLLKIHMRTHNTEKNHQCPHCSKSFRACSTLKTHVRTHTGERPYQCARCGKLFKQSSTLYVHMMVHPGEKAEKTSTCLVCSKQFRTKHALKEHMMTHSGERPHQCPECGKQFRRGNHLNRHMLVHTGEKPHTCHACHRQFREAGNLKQHMRTHMGEKAHQPSRSRKQITETKD